MLISIFVGFLGLDRFYDGQIGWGVLKGATLGALGAWWVADAAYYTYLAGKGE
jgi:TM2 domain-containing membrane protein YozV